MGLLSADMSPIAQRDAAHLTGRTTGSFPAWAFALVCVIMGVLIALTFMLYWKLSRRRLLDEAARDGPTVLASQANQGSLPPLPPPQPLQPRTPPLSQELIGYYAPPTLPALPASRGPPLGNAEAQEARRLLRGHYEPAPAPRSSTPAPQPQPAPSKQVFA